MASIATRCTHKTSNIITLDITTHLIFRRQQIIIRILIQMSGQFIEVIDAQTRPFTIKTGQCFIRIGSLLAIS